MILPDRLYSLVQFDEQTCSTDTSVVRSIMMQSDASVLVDAESP